MVEFSLVFMILMMIAIGAFEWGMGFRDSLSMAASAREGARVTASVGTVADADCTILEAAAGALQATSGNKVKEIWIYKSDTSGTVTGTRQVYRPSVPADNPASLKCGTWYPVTTTYPPANRDNDGATRDWVGVKVAFAHQWKTGFLWWKGAANWEERAVMHLEPKAP
jgi:Flp pilus assembly protein TadG